MVLGLSVLILIILEYITREDHGKWNRMSGYDTDGNDLGWKYVCIPKVTLIHVNPLG